MRSIYSLSELYIVYVCIGIAACSDGGRERCNQFITILLLRVRYAYYVLVASRSIDPRRRRLVRAFIHNALARYVAHTRIYNTYRRVVRSSSIILGTAIKRTVRTSMYNSRWSLSPADKAFRSIMAGERRVTVKFEIFKNAENRTRYNGVLKAYRSCTA